MKKTAFIVALVLCAILAMGSTAIAGQKGPTSTPMTASFRDKFPGSSNYVSPPDRIGSDGQGMYVDGVTHVKAIIDYLTDFDLDTNTGGGSNIRYLYLDFGAPCIPNSNPLCKTPPSAPFPSATVDAYLSTYHGALTTMVYGDSHSVGLAVNFPGWFIRFGIPPWETETTTVQVRCVGPQTGTCDTWEIEASPTDVGKLLKVSKRGMEDNGSFYMPFKLTVQKLPK